MAQLEKISCDTCQRESAYLLWDDRYNGYRGVCPDCDGNWPES